MNCVCATASGYWQRATFRPLTGREVNWADDIAQRRFDSAIAHGWQDYLSAPSVESNKLGTRAELAFCLFFGLTWPATVDVFTSIPDAPPDYEIRCSRQGTLKIRPKEVRTTALRNRRYVLLTPCEREYSDDYLTTGGSFHLIGWIRPREVHAVKLTDPGDRKRPAYFLLPEQLHRLPFHDAKMPK